MAAARNPAEEYAVLAYEHRKYAAKAKATVTKLGEQAAELWQTVEPEFGDADYLRVRTREGGVLALKRVRTRKPGQATPKRVIEYAHQLPTGEDLEAARAIAEELAQEHEANRARYHEQLEKARARDERQAKRQAEAEARETRKRTRETQDKERTRAARYARRLKERVQTDET